MLNEAKGRGEKGDATIIRHCTNCQQESTFTRDACDSYYICRECQTGADIETLDGPMVFDIERRKIWVCKDCEMRPTYFPDAVPVCNHCGSENVEEISDPGPLLHLFGQSHWHDDAFIITNYEALQQLRLAIDEALARGRGKRLVYCNDGEGYYIQVIIRELEWDQRAVPYTEPAADEKRDDALYPWQEIKEEK